MGAINFYGGTWLGGGAGFCYKEQTRTICTECGEENYITHKNKRKHPERLELRKYCSRCQKETVHREKK